MLNAVSSLSVVPVLIGPMATLLPILVGALVAIVVMVSRFLRQHILQVLIVAAIFVVYKIEPLGFTVPWLKCLGWFLEFVVAVFLIATVFVGIVTRRISLLVLAALVAGFSFASANNWWRVPPVAPPGAAGLEWPVFRGDAARTGRVADSPDPTNDEPVWSVTPTVPGQANPYKTFFSSPCVVGDRVYIASCDKGPLRDRGALFCLDAASGAVVWAYPTAADKAEFRATYSSPSVAYKHAPDGKVDQTAGYVVCGEGLHLTDDAYVVCLNLKGELLWRYRTAHHVESSPCIADGRAYIGAGEDGYYCFDLEPKAWDDKANKVPTPTWHIGGIKDTSEKYCDCETCPIVVDGVLYLGLGKNGGQAVLAVDPATGKELWRVHADYPVYASPAICQRIVVGKDGKRRPETLMFYAMGNADVLETAEEVRVGWPMRKDRLIAKGFAPERLNRLERLLDKDKYRTDGEVWCFNLTAIKNAAATQPDLAVQPEWRLKVPQSVLGVACDPPDESADPVNGSIEGRIYFGSWDGNFYCYSTAMRQLARRDFLSPMPNNPAIGKDYVYVATKGGTLCCLDKLDLRPLWQSDLGQKQVSSPAIAHGHIYIGTNDDGVRCLGQPKPIPPMWNQGATGGLSDRTPLPDRVAFRTKYPATADPQFAVTAPIMPLAQLMTVAEPVNPAPATARPSAGAPASQPQTRQVEKLVRFVYVSVARLGGNEVRHGQPGSPTFATFQLLKVRLSDLGRRGVEPIAWAKPFDQPITVAPAAVDASIYVVESKSLGLPDLKRRLREHNSTDVYDSVSFYEQKLNSGPHDAILYCLDLDGNEKWKAFYPQDTGQFTIEAQFIYIWRGPNTLDCVDRETGYLHWYKDCPGGHCVGPPSAGNGLVVAATTENLTVLDAATGSILWTEPVPDFPTAGPVRVGSSILLPTANGVYRISLAGGQAQWHAAIGRVVQSLVVDSEKLVAVVKVPVFGWQNPTGLAPIPTLRTEGRLHVLSLDDGQPWRLKDGQVEHDGKKLPAIRRVAPIGPIPGRLASVDSKICPVLAGDRIVFGGVKELSEDEIRAGKKAETDLMLLSLPEKYQPSAENVAQPPPAVNVAQPPSAVIPEIGPRAARSTPEAGVPHSERPAEPITELVSIEPTRWCEAAVLGPITQPLVLVEGTVYTATANLGLVVLTRQK